MKSLINKFTDFSNNLNNFYRNIWNFRKSLWSFRWWDYSYTLYILQDSLKEMSKGLEHKGTEVKETRMKKVQKINRVIELIENIKQTNFIEQAEKELGELYDLEVTFDEIPDRPDLKRLVTEGDEEQLKHNNSVYKRAQEIEEQQFNEVFDILKGQDINEYRKMKNPSWNKWFDGSGINHWWD
jgi:hypothetical protein